MSAVGVVHFPFTVSIRSSCFFGESLPALLLPLGGRKKSFKFEKSFCLGPASPALPVEGTYTEEARASLVLDNKISLEKRLLLQMSQKKDTFVYLSSDPFGDPSMIHDDPRAFFEISWSHGMLHGSSSIKQVSYAFRVVWLYITLRGSQVVVSNLFHFHPYLGKSSNLTNIFFKWVETTTVSGRVISTFQVGTECRLCGGLG